MFWRRLGKRFAVRNSNETVRFTREREENEVVLKSTAVHERSGIKISGRQVSKAGGGEGANPYLSFADADAKGRCLLHFILLYSLFR